jgi:predicted nucleotide-binding protein (sugar kinase/HSP70/actin superfamily)
MPKVLNVWSPHQFWLGFLTTLGLTARHIVFSSDTSEEQYRTFGKGRGTVESCYPVKCISGHYGELIFGQQHKLDVLLAPMSPRCPPSCAGRDRHARLSARHGSA